MPGPRQLESDLAWELWLLPYPQSHAIPQRGVNITVGLVQTPQWVCDLFRRTPFLLPSSNSVLPIAWITACASDARQVAIGILASVYLAICVAAVYITISNFTLVCTTVGSSVPSPWVFNILKPLVECRFHKCGFSNGHLDLQNIWERKT